MASMWISASALWTLLLFLVLATSEARLFSSRHRSRSSRLSLSLRTRRGTRGFNPFASLGIYGRDRGFRDRSFDSWFYDDNRFGGNNRIFDDNRFFFNDNRNLGSIGRGFRTRGFNSY